MARLGDICEKVTDYVASGSFAALKENVLITNEENYAIMVKTADFSNGFTKALTYTDKRGYDFLKNSNLFGGELILSNIGSIGKVFKVPYLDRPMTLASNTVMIKTATPELTDYLYYYFLSPAGYKSLLSISSGTSMLKFNKTELKKLEIPIPDIDKQRRIIAVMDKVSNLISLRKQQLAKLDELVKARFVEMFGGIHDSKMYPYKLVNDLTDVISGGTPSRDVNEYWEGGTIPWVKTTELQNNYVTEVEEYITEEGLNNSSAKIVPAGTVLIAMYGQGKTRGMTAYLGIEACTNQACACILPSDKINQTFLWQFFVLSYDNLRNRAKGGNQPNLNGNIIKNYPVLYPPIELQEQFAAFVKQTDKSKAAVQKALDEAQLLFDSLMQKYFE
mgnify:CR=1 FL=1